MPLRSLRVRLAILVIVAMLPAFGLLAWLRGETRRTELERVRQEAGGLAQLVAESQLSRHESARVLLLAILHNESVRRRNVPACNAYFSGLLRENADVYVNFGLIDRRGDLVCAARSVPGINVSDRPYFARILRTRQFTISEMVLSRTTGRLVLHYAMPVIEGDEVTGVVVASLNVDALNASLARVKLPPGGVITIVDRRGVIVARHPDRSRVGEQRELSLLLQAPVKRVSTAERPGPDGVHRMYAMVPVDDDRSAYALAGLDVIRAAAIADGRFNAALLILAAAMCIAFAIVFLIAERDIRRPIVRLLDAAGEWGRGDLTSRASLRAGAQELQHLGDAFDQMAERLAQRELHVRQSQRLEAIGQLAGGVAHDFNNILTVIMGFGAELEPHVQHAEGKQYLAEVLGAANRAKELTHRLLAFSRRQILKPKPVLLNETVASLYGMLRRVIGEDVALMTHLGPELGIVRADPAQLEQVLLNLVINARDAMPSGGTLTIETSNLDVAQRDELIPVGEATGIPPGRYVRLCVSDTGRGMDAETAARIFEPFFSTKGAKGTGLGLAMVYGIVKQSNGFLRCETAPGRGTTFHVYFPRTTERLEAAPQPPVPVRETSGSETILLVEDEPAVRSMAETVLRQRGYRVVAAESGPVALARINDGLRPDLLLTDLVMPGVDGTTLARTARTLCDTMRVVFMSGYGEHAAVPPGEAPAPQVLAKPFTPQVLLARVRAALDATAA